MRKNGKWKQYFDFAALKVHSYLRKLTKTMVYVD